MLLPPFRGADLLAFDRHGDEITSDVFAPSGFLKVDANYTAKPFEEWRAEDWPRTYMTPKYPNLFGVGIAFAPPHPISRPRTSAKGTVISPAPPRTGMPSGLMGRQVARSIADMIQKGATAPTHTASMAEMGRVRRLGGSRVPQGNRGVDDDVPHRARLCEASRLRP